MSKTYALLDIDHTLLIEKIEANGERTKIFNENIVNALTENNISNVYLFTDMVMGLHSIEESKWLIEQLQLRGLTVWGVLSTSDLFWAADHHQLAELQVYAGSREFNMGLLNNDYSALFTKIQAIGLALQNTHIIAHNILGKAFFDVETTSIAQQEPSAFNISKGAVISARVLSNLIPGRPHQKALLYQHFVRHKPLDCTRCVIFEDKAEVIQSTLAISQNDDLKRIAIKVERGDFDDLGSRRRYSHEIQNFLIQENLDQVQLHVPPQADQGKIKRESITENSNSSKNNVVRQTWPDITSLAFKKLDETYYKQRGFKFFSSSDDSLALLNKLKSYAITANSKQAFIVNYLNDEENNKGKRLYTLLVELRHAHRQMQLLNQQPEVWLTKDMLYLIEEEYKKSRGFILFGSTCSESAELRDDLNKDNLGLIEKQNKINNYMRNPEYAGKRMHDVLLKVLNQPVSISELTPPRP